MNDDFADALVIPAMEHVAELMREEDFDGAVLWGDQSTEGHNEVRFQLNDYWSQVDGTDLMDKTEHWMAEAMQGKGVRRWVFATPISYGAEPDAHFMVAHVAVLDPKMIWALCYEEGSGFDVCAIFYVQRPDGTYTFDQDITMLEDQNQMLEGAPGFTLMKDLLEAT